MGRRKDVDWNMHGADGPGPVPVEAIKVNVLMDIRDELKSLNESMRRVGALLGCRNFTALPAHVRGIRKLLAEPPRRRKR